jgi:hypothetical protein
MVHYNASSFISLIGMAAWRERMQTIMERVSKPTRTSKLAANQFAAECAIEKARRGMALTQGEAALVNLATRIPELHDSLNTTGKTRLHAAFDTALLGEGTIVPLLHLMHTAQLQQSRGFDVNFSGFKQATPFDLLISRDGVDAEIVCDTISAEEGHIVQRGAWSSLADGMDPDLQTWLAAHPGRYLLKMTLPQGLTPACGPNDLAALQARIKNMLASAKRSDYDEAAVLRLDPLLLAGAQASDVKFAAGGILAKLRREFGPEAHFAVTEAGPSMFIMAARGGAENEVAGAVRRRMAAIAPARLTGTRPGILAMMIEDTEARQFLTFPEARSVIAVTCASRFELTRNGVPEGDLRYRNPKHPDSKSPALAPAVLSTT